MASEAGTGHVFEPKDLQKLVLLPVASDWWDVGLQLGIPKHRLSTIQVSHMGHPKGPQRCLGDALDWWLKNTTDPSYEKLETALTNTDNGEGATKLSRSFAQGTLFEPKDLQKLVLLPVAFDWWDVGLQLGIPKHTLSTIQASHMGHPKGPQRCLGDALDWWLKNTNDPSYEKLKTALTNTENGEGVTKLSQMYGNGIHSEATSVPGRSIHPRATKNPTLVELIDYVKTTNWFKLGLKLGLEEFDLEVIEKDKRLDTEGALEAMLRKWLQSSKDPTWKAVVDASRAIKDERLAKKLEEKFC